MAEDCNECPSCGWTMITGVTGLKHCNECGATIDPDSLKKFEEKQPGDESEHKKNIHEVEDFIKEADKYWVGKKKKQPKTWVDIIQYRALEDVIDNFDAQKLFKEWLEELNTIIDNADDVSVTSNGTIRVKDLETYVTGGIHRFIKQRLVVG